MKKLLAVFFIMLLLPAGRAALTSWDVDITLNDDKTTQWTVNFLYNETVAKSDYFILSYINNYEVYADDKLVQCKTEQDVGTLILCDPINAKNITYIFKTAPQVRDILQNYRLFTNRLTATQLTDKYTVTVRLPVGSVLGDETKLTAAALKPFEPDFGVEGSDGRQIYIKWLVDNPKLGETLNVAVVYEQLSQINNQQIGIFVFIIVALVAAFVVVLLFVFKKPPIKDILPILTEGERKVMEIVLREKGEVDQRVIVKETDFSKAKVSRVINDLIDRGIVEKISKGRKNVIKLRKSIKPQKPAKTENPENKNQNKAFIT